MYISVLYKIKITYHEIYIRNDVYILQKTKPKCLETLFRADISKKVIMRLHLNNW